MELTFESDRLAFRPLLESDLDLAIEQWADPDVVKYVGGKVMNEEDIASEMPLYARRCAGGAIGIWCVTEKATSDKLGTAVLLPMLVEKDDTDWDLLVGDDIPDADIEVGYILKKSAWGKGYATEACKRMLQFAFDATPLDTVMATIDPANNASRHVLLKSCLREVGQIRAYAEDIPGFEITRAEWLARQS